MEVYFEPQSGGNCRIHAINNCFGGKHISPEQFCKYYNLYRSQINEEANIEFDYVHADSARESLLSFIIQCKFKLSTFTVGQYELRKLTKQRIVRSLLDFIDFELQRFFICSSSHVFCVRNVNGKWVQIDGGVHDTTIEQWEKDPSLTFVFPWTFRRCQQGVCEMQRLVKNRFPDSTLKSISAEIIHDLSKREPSHFGDCETWIALFFKYLKITRPIEREVVERYTTYSSGSPLDIVNALQHLPLLILFIIQFDA